ncbi:MAG: multi-sensor hybrid histidine kinase [Gemmatimonadetes bacterium]|nr:multi-sensor hybrid histidine kinase [Gemmatimonadota bacterium]
MGMPSHRTGKVAPQAPHRATETVEGKTVGPLPLRVAARIPVPAGPLSHILHASSAPFASKRAGPELRLAARAGARLDLARTTRRALRLGVGLLALVSAVALMQIGRSTRAGGELAAGQEVMRELDRLQEVTVELRTFEEDGALGSSRELGGEWRSLVHELERSQEALHAALEGNGSDSPLLDTLDRIAEEHLAFATSPMEADRQAAARSLRQVSLVQRRLESGQRAILAGRSASVRRETRGAVLAIVIAMLVALCFAYFAQRVVERELERRESAEVTQDRMSGEAATQAEELQAQNVELLDWSERLHVAHKEAEAANLAKSEFLAVMSHELRTPLNSIIGFANVLHKNKRNTLDETDRLYLDRLRANSVHLLGLINQVLDLAKVEAGHMEISLTPTDIGALARTVVGQLEGEQQDSIVELRAEVPGNLAMVNTDGDKLRQVLINLVSNALKFTRAGEVSVRIAADVLGRPISIEVVDTGIGMDAERLGRVFDAFDQGGSEITREFGGTGLGLSISRALCGALGHSLTATSVPGVGSTFTIALHPALAA